MPPMTPALLQHIGTLERMRRSTVLVLAASHLDFDLLPALYEECRRFGRAERLDVVLQGRGGVVNAARRIALLLRDHADHLAFIVPFHCQSSATLLTLCADEIVAGELALFSPIDPQLGGADGSSFSGLDVKQFGDMAASWFGLAQDAARAESLALLCNSIFPPSLTAFYRANLEIEQIAHELLASRRAASDRAADESLVRQLTAGYHSHNYAITGGELAALGLPARRDEMTEQLAWPISALLQATVGGAQRASEQAPWIDALLATRAGVRLRRRHAAALAPEWVDGAAE
jgi:Serine dehydrogenase proteinase